MNENDSKISSKSDPAIASRLAKLRTMPVDTSRLDAMIRARIPRERPSILRIFRPLVAVAASLLVVGLLSAILLTSGGDEVLASPAQMAQVHQELLANRNSMTQVNSIEEAARVLAASTDGGSPQSSTPPTTHVMACCMKSIKDKKIACVLLETEDKPVTMSVAKSADMKMPNVPSVYRDGATYFVQSYQTLNMVTVEKQGRWVCLMGEVSAKRLVELGSRLQF